MAGLIAYGKRMYGKVDAVGKLFYVSTPCSHFCFLPIVPHGSMIVIEKRGRECIGVRIPLCLKSWLIGWLQVILTGLLVFLGVMLAALISLYVWGQHVDYSNIRWALFRVAPAFAILAVLLLLTMTWPAIRCASPDRARQLAEMAPLNDKQRAELEAFLRSHGA